MPSVEQADLTTEQPRVRVRVNEILNRRPAVGFALAVVRGGDLESFTAHGLADIATRRSVTLDTVFRVGSITKTFTAIAVMQLVERGLVELDAPANDYLRAYKLVPADPAHRPATLRHLLTHTAGVSEQVPRSGLLRPNFGETVPAGRPVPSLAEYYRGELRLAAEPGTRFRYTDHGPATLGQLVADVSGQPLHRYLHDHVFAPLGMTDTTMLPSEVDRERLATGYRIGRHGPVEVPAFEYIPAGAGAAFSTPRDMARYAVALLAGGGNEHGAVLRAESLEAMFAPQYRSDPRLPGLGLAFWRVDAGGHRAVEHQGVIPPYFAQLYAAPDDDVGLVAFTNGTRGGSTWLAAETGALLDSLLGVPEPTVRADVPERPDVWADLCGRYTLPGPATLTDVRVRGVVGAGLQLRVRGGRLVLRALTPVRALYRGLVLHPDDDGDPYAFRIEVPQLGSLRVVFTPPSADSPAALHLDGMPLTAYRGGSRAAARHA
ncbi:CubicO group peptidase (beta-lactamase class C family) [Georgenia soli]|uniref:CubicO group peptidase (Beta-lactamase class C family) n=1 Tax=Georgenia soli TaxID=638953 RepID=A0A2A9EHA3_9MICO|nr:serine hydrolase domain-containing protein [Georgenia soli]PFG38223.1 CubicO group peptidase (beta-lactamase class C family) [Georgenia soli]